MDASGLRISIENLKLSLKILHPPGGASSNIFGINEEGVDYEKRKLTKDHMQSDIFAPADLSTPSPSTRQRPTNNTQTRLFGEPEVLAQQEPEVKNKDSEATEKKPPSDRKGFDPITGQSYAQRSSSGNQAVRSVDSAQPLTAATPGSKTRPRQPPGGVASQLW